ncbi:MAG: choice-of-anchor D domain-containing protein, partial [Acidobacteriota bacterium]|nr:choice-of-anchor D domain-containing protein [Acidobacteriota bacterium]
MNTTLQYQFAGLSSSPQFVLRYGLDFSAAASTCSGSGTMVCTIKLGFSPRYTGVREDALFIKNGDGTLLYTTLLHGLGLGASAFILPGTINTVAGIPGMWGYAADGGQASAANFANPQNIASDMCGNLYVADSINQVVRQINATTHVIRTVAGMAYKAGFSGDGGPATSAKLNTPWSVALDGAGNLYIADYGNNRVRRVDAVTGIITTVAGGGTARSGSDGLGDGGLATNAQLSGPADLVLDPSGTLYIADSVNGLIRKVDLTTQTITAVAGGGADNSGTNSLGDGGLATNGVLKCPTGLALDSGGNLYIADKGSNVVRAVNLATNIISTVAGSGGWGFYGDNGPAASANFSGPVAVRTDAAGNLYIVDYGNSVVREVSAATHIISTPIGNGSSGYGGDGGNPSTATLSNPTGITHDPTGRVLVVDSGNNIVRLVTPTQQLTFPSTAVGLASPAQVLTMVNTGNQRLSVSSLNMSAGFSQQSSGGIDCSSASVLAPGASCQIALVFAPLSGGSTSGQLTISSASLSTPIKILLGGTGTGTTGGQVILSPTSLNFGNQNLNTTSAAQIVTLTNKTSGALSISYIWFAGLNSSDYRFSTTCGTTLASGANCAVSISFSPSALGSRVATVSFNDTAANSPQNVSLGGIGVGVPQLGVSSSALNFASQSLSAAPAVQTITLSNTGSGILSINSISINGANSSDFVQAGNCSSLAAGSSCNISVWFAPTAIGTRTGSLAIASSAGSAVQGITLNGTAVSSLQLYKFTPINGNFETGSISPWNVIGSATIVSTVHSGSYGLREQAATSTTFAYQDVYGLVPGQSYLVSAWVKASTSGTNGVELWLHDTSGQNIAGNVVYPGTSWQQVTTTFTATNTSAVRIHLCDFTGSASIYWDDITVSLAVSNGDFERGLSSPWNLVGVASIGLQAHSGSYGLTEQAVSGTTLAYQDVSGLIPGQTYVVSAWVKSSTATTNGAELWLHDTNGQGIAGTVVYPGTGWQQITTLFKATNTGAVRIHLCDFAGPESLYWDDVTIAPALANGDFESGSATPWNVIGNASLGSIPHSRNLGLTEQASAAATLVFQDVNGLVPGQSYLLSAWVKSSSAGTTGAELWL